jgi:hypothetical protein
MKRQGPLNAISDSLGNAKEKFHNEGLEEIGDILSLFTEVQTPGIVFLPWSNCIIPN